MSSTPQTIIYKSIQPPVQNYHYSAGTVLNGRTLIRLKHGRPILLNGALFGTHCAKQPPKHRAPKGSGHWHSAPLKTR